MNLYLITQTERDGYDTYDSAVVCAKTAEGAARIHPSGRPLFQEPEDPYGANPHPATAPNCPM